MPAKTPRAVWAEGSPVAHWALRAPKTNRAARNRLHANVAQFAQAASACPEVLECHITLGTIDCLLRIVTSNMLAYEHFFFNKLLVLPGVQEVNSVVSLSEIKSTTVLPLADASATRLLDHA
jgi:DNA-binding Lrp family transcriptional regulator